MKSALKALKHRIRRALRPVLTPIRDWQAPRLHRFMIGAGTPTNPTLNTALVIAPHHDDETFGCGGVIALKRQAGVNVDIVILTDGKQSHGNDGAVDQDLLANTRKTEALAAVAVLGVPAERVHFFDLPDQGLSSLDPQRRQASVAKLAELMNDLQPGEVYINHRNDHHPDHEAAFRITADAIAQSGLTPQVLQYPIWLIWKGPARMSLRPGELAHTVRVDVQSVQDAKNRAIQIYISQLPVLPPGFVEQFMQGCEVFFRE